jgi:hypothetical protein
MRPSRCRSARTGSIVPPTASSRTGPSAPRKSCMRFVPCWLQALRSKLPPSHTQCGCTNVQLCGEQRLNDVRRILDHIDVDPQHSLHLAVLGTTGDSDCAPEPERRSNWYAGAHRGIPAGMRNPKSRLASSTRRHLAPESRCSRPSNVSNVSSLLSLSIRPSDSKLRGSSTPRSNSM